MKHISKIVNKKNNIINYPKSIIKIILINIYTSGILYELTEECRIVDDTRYLDSYKEYLVKIFVYLNITN